MMFNKSTIIISALLVANTVTAADLRIKSMNDENIGNVIHSKDEIESVLKNIPMNTIRKLNSETCESETTTIEMNEGVQDALAGVDIYNLSTDSPFCSGSDTKVSCDLKDAYSGLEAACDSAGGQLFQYSVTLKTERVSVSYKNMASCIGASCDTDAALKVQEDYWSLFTEFGYEVTVKESGASTVSTCESETTTIEMNQGVQDALAGASLNNYVTSPYCSTSGTNTSCDLKEAYSGLELACDIAGGKLFLYSVTLEGEGVTISFKNMADCIGASCDKNDEVKEKEETFSFFNNTDYEVTVKESVFEVTIEESGASTFSSAVAALMVFTGVVGTLI